MKSLLWLASELRDKTETKQKLNENWTHSLRTPEVFPVVASHPPFFSAGETRTENTGCSRRLLNLWLLSRIPVRRSKTSKRNYWWWYKRQEEYVVPLFICLVYCAINWNLKYLCIDFSIAPYKGIWITESEKSFCLHSVTYSDSSSVYSAIVLGSIFLIGLKEISLKEI